MYASSNVTAQGAGRVGALEVNVQSDALSRRLESDTGLGEDERKG